MSTENTKDIKLSPHKESDYSSLPISNKDIWEISKKIVECLKTAVGMPPEKVNEIWFDQLEEDWFDWLEEKLRGNENLITK